MLQMPQESRAGVVMFVPLCDPAVKVLLSIPMLLIPWTPALPQKVPCLLLCFPVSCRRTRQKSSRPGCGMPNLKEVCSELGAAAGMQGTSESQQVPQWFQGKRTTQDAEMPLPSLRLSTGSGTGILW